MALSDAKRHIDRVGKGEPVNGLQDEGQAQSLFQLDDNGLRDKVTPLIGAEYAF